MPGCTIEQLRADRATIGGSDLTVFAGCNYLGLAHHPVVLEAVREATTRYGLSTSASRETSGNTPVHEELESRVAGYIAGGSGGARSAVRGLLVPDGYTANLAAMQALAADHPVAAVDRRAHASLADAARCAGMEVRFFAHRDAGDLRRVLGATGDRAAVLTDGVFTADGAVAPVRALLDALREGDRLVVDDCHGFGVLGGGRGLCAREGIDLGGSGGRVVITTTLAKGLGGGGGIVVGEANLIDRARAKSTAYVCTTPVSPLVASGTLAALGVLEGEPGRVERLARNARTLRDAVLGADEGAREPVPICAWPVETRDIGERLTSGLRQRGLFVPLMAYPGGPSPWYLRASVTSEHTEDEIVRLGACFEELA